MSQISDITTWVQTDMLKRSDLTTLCNDSALNFYKILCYKVPFDELMTTATFNTVANQAGPYNLSSLIPTLKAISDIQITFAPNVARRLRRSHIRVYDALSFSTASKPGTYARYGLAIYLNPPPDSSNYTLQLRYWAKPTINATPSLTTIQTPDEWDELIRWETYWRVLNALGQYERASMLMQPAMMPRQNSPKRQLDFEVGIIPRLWNELLSTISQKENVDEDFNINPVVRAYSFRGRG